METKRDFDLEAIEAYQVDPDFSYIYETQQTNWWAGIAEWLTDLLANLFQNQDPAEIGLIVYRLMQILIWSILAFASGMIAYSLYKRGIFGVVGKRDKVLSIPFNELESNVLDTDWEKLIKDAVLEGRYNLATRLLFLQVLKQLNNEGLINWNKSKTIRDYQKELKTEYHQSFYTLGKYYQYAWFGQVTINESRYNEMQSQFIRFNESLDVE